MENITAKKNVVLGFSLIYWIFALVLFITGRNDFDKTEKQILIDSMVYAAVFCVSSCIPIVGWIFAVVILVFYIIEIVQVFRGIYDYKAPIISAIAKNFNKD